MILQEQMRILAHRNIAKDIFEMTLQGNITKEIKGPGQFVHIRTSAGLDPLLRRPISIASVDTDESCFTVIYRAEGKGTKLLSEKKPDDTADVLGPLGNGFPADAAAAGETALLVGGGIGVPPLYELSKRLNEKGVRVKHVLGFERAEKVFYSEQFSLLGETHVATVDGSFGTKGFVTDTIDRENMEFDQLYACGPIPMLKALEERFHGRRGYLSLEQRMGCGIGACFACVCHTADGAEGRGYIKVCTDGPVFPIGKVVLA
ncbi:MAG TPA: dihydroorotate dehydrogenase electron transfer subunit [Bacillaceae bacterium]